MVADRPCPTGLAFMKCRPSQGTALTLIYRPGGVGRCTFTAGVGGGEDLTELGISGAVTLWSTYLLLSNS